MKVLHILRTEPDDTVKKLMENLSSEAEATVTALYEKEVDWSGVVDDIFSHDKVICWW
jgi:hypothetical protein